MTWFKVDDSLPDHPDVLTLLGLRGGLAALGLWVLSGAWSARQLTAGSITAIALKRLGGTKKQAELLVQVGFWERVEGGYQFRNWSKYQPSPESVKAKRAAARERMKQKRSREHSQTKDENVLLTRPDPTRPEKEPPLPPSASEPGSTEPPTAGGDELGPGRTLSRETREVFDHWVRVMAKPNAKLTSDRRQKIQARLREGYTVSQLKSAIDGCSRNPWHMGANSEGKVYNDLITILRTGSKLEQHLESTPEGPARAPNPYAHLKVFT